jgi:hypothetical protein
MAAVPPVVPPVVAPWDSFRVVLRDACGITQAVALQAIHDQGYDTMLAFSALNDEDIVNFHKSITRTIPNPRAQVNIPYASIKKLQIMRLWTLWRIRQGIAIVHANYNDAAIRWATDRFEWERGLKINKPDTPDAPAKFNGFGDKWRSFSDGFFGMMSAVRGTMNIPLSYVFREHVVPTPEIGLAAAALPSDDYLMMVVSFNIPEFTTDNRRAWEHLRPLLFDTPAWEYVKRYDATKDARTAFRTLTLRGEGDAATEARKVKAESDIATAKFTGQGKAWTINKYINTLVGAFNDLESCGTVKTEFEKVTALLHGIEDPKYNSSVAFILGSPQLRHDFQAAYNYLETVHQFSNSGIMGKKGFDRNVSGVSTGGDTMADGRVPKEVWDAMSDKERKALLNKRKAARKGGSGNRGGNNNSGQNGGVKLTKGQKKKVAQFRKLEEVATSLMETLDAMGQEVGKGSTSLTKRSAGSPSEQFGRKVKETRRLLKAVTGKRVDDDDDE